jgi:hypothetical protein
MNRKNLLQTLKGLLMLALLTFGANRSWAQWSPGGVATDPLCNGEYSGSISFEPDPGNIINTGGYKSNFDYYIDSGSGYQAMFTVYNETGDTSISGLKAGSYKIQVEDWFNAGGTVSETLVLVDPDLLSLSASQYNPKCFGEVGGVKLSATGGTSSVSYSFKKENGCLF